LNSLTAETQSNIEISDDDDDDDDDDHSNNKKSKVASVRNKLKMRHHW